MKTTGHRPQEKERETHESVAANTRSAGKGKGSRFSSSRLLNEDHGLDFSSRTRGSPDPPRSFDSKCIPPIIGEASESRRSKVVNSPHKTMSGPKAKSRSQRLGPAAVSPQSDTSGGDRRRSLGNSAGAGEATGSAMKYYSGRKGRRATLGFRPVVPVTGDGGETGDVGEEDDVNASFCTAKGETSPGADLGHLASGIESDLFQSFLESSPDFNQDSGVVIQSPVTFGAVVHDDCPSTLVKKMAGLRIDEAQSDTPTTVVTAAPGGLDSNNVGKQSAENATDSLEPSSPAVSQGVEAVKLTFSPKNDGSVLEAPRFMFQDKGEDGTPAGSAFDGGLSVGADREVMSPSNVVEVEQFSSSSPKEVKQVLGVPKEACVPHLTSFDLRQAAEGDVNVDVDCERSAIFDEMLQTASGANTSPEKSVVLSLVEKEAMELAASFVVEVETTALTVVDGCDSLTNEEASRVGLTNEDLKDGFTNEEPSQARSTTNEALWAGSTNEEYSQAVLTNDEVPHAGVYNKKETKARSTNEEASREDSVNQEAPLKGANEESRVRSPKKVASRAGADGLTRASTVGNVVCAQMRTTPAVSFSTSGVTAQAGTIDGNRRLSFLARSSATSRLVKPRRKSMGNVARVPEVAPESTERYEGADRAVGRASRDRTRFGFGTGDGRGRNRVSADGGATRKISRGISPDIQAQQMHHKTKRSKSEGPREASEEKETMVQEERKTVSRLDQVAVGRNRRNTLIGNFRRGQSLTVFEGPAIKTASRLGGRNASKAGGLTLVHPDKDEAAASQGNSKGLTVPEPFHLSASNRPGSATSTPRSREECLTFGERMVHMETKVPDRFIKRPAGEQCKPAASAPFNPKPTVPRSPKLRTEARAAVNKSHLKTLQEREEEDLAYMKKHQFKARRYSADNFGISGEQGVICKHHSEKPLTKQEPFRLSTGTRSTKKLTSKDDGEVAKQFKARPLPSLRSSSVGRARPGSQENPEILLNVGLRSLTVAESPMLLTERRSVLRSSMGGGERRMSSEQAEVEDSRANQFKARPMPDYVKLRRQSVNPADKPVAVSETEPSSQRTEERGKAKSALLEHRRLAQRRKEEAVKNVRARTRAWTSRGSVPDEEDFRLSSQVRHERAAREFREKIRREEEEARHASKVTARPLPASTFAPEPYPEKSEVAITQPMEIPLHSSLRAQQRARWDRENEARLKAEERQRLELEAATAAAEKQEITELRRRSIDAGGMTFKAKPIVRAPKPAEEPHPSTARLTHYSGPEDHASRKE